MIAKLSMPQTSEVFRQPAEIATNKGFGQRNGCVAVERLRGTHPTHLRRPVFPALRDEEALFVVVQVDPVKDSWIVRREDHLLVMLLGQLDKVRDERRDELRVE